MSTNRRNNNILFCFDCHLQQLKRKEKENEHEMERLAKEKIAKQEKLKLLRHQISTRFDNMHSTTIQLPDGEGINGIRERGTNKFACIFTFNIRIFFLLGIFVIISIFPRCFIISI